MSEKLTLETIGGAVIFATWTHAASCSICDTAEKLCLFVRRKDEHGEEIDIPTFICKECLVFIECARQIDPGPEPLAIVKEDSR